MKSSILFESQYSFDYRNIFSVLNLLRRMPVFQTTYVKCSININFYGNGLRNSPAYYTVKIPYFVNILVIPLIKYALQVVMN